MKKFILGMILVSSATTAMARDLDVNINLNNDRLRSCREKVRELKRERVTLQNSNDVISANLSQCRSDLANGGNRGDIRRVRRELRETKQSLDNANSTITRLENKVDRKNERISELNLRIQDLEDQLNPVPVPNDFYTVNGVVEREGYLYEVVDVVDFFDKCARQFKNISRADNASIAVNFSGERTLSTGGWWVGAGRVCSELSSKLARTNVPTNLTARYTVQGSVESTLINIKADTKTEVMRKCQRKLSEAGVSRADSFEVLVNGSQYKVKTTGGWWNGSATICNEVVKTIN
ncbi:hypothetical protein A9Q84_06625 [Halobacteriovorax marinus]|uniref:Uncharacterized protein n=1 Tax=Halobacteriovorax marinus TaxID=97084 RepID=A0A1Y5F9R5_9BACT|nr:hypothetical protein A9Q84_06625 [Halobacteriovorax marinus]